MPAGYAPVGPRYFDNPDPYIEADAVGTVLGRVADLMPPVFAEDELDPLDDDDEEDDDGFVDEEDELDPLDDDDEDAELPPRPPPLLPGQVIS